MQCPSSLSSLVSAPSSFYPPLYIASLNFVSAADISGCGGGLAALLIISIHAAWSSIPSGVPAIGCGACHMGNAISLFFLNNPRLFAHHTTSIATSQSAVTTRTVDNSICG